MDGSGPAYKRKLPDLFPESHPRQRLCEKVWEDTIGLQPMEFQLQPNTEARSPDTIGLYADGVSVSAYRWQEIHFFFWYVRSKLNLHRLKARWYLCSRAIVRRKLKLHR